MGKFTTITTKLIKENIFILIFSIVFICFICFAAQYSILSADDFFAVHLINSQSLTKAITEVYTNWSFRLNAILINYLFCSTLNNSVSLFNFQLVSYFYIGLTSFFILKNILKTETNFKTLLLSIALTAVFYFSSHDSKEAVFWMAGSTSYLYAIPFFFSGLLLAHNKSISILNALFVILLFFGAGGFSEVYAITFIIMLVYLLIKKIILKQQYSLLLIAFFACSTPFLINYSAPGNAVRAAFLPAPSFINAFVIGTKTLIKIVTIYTQLYQLIALLIACIIIKQVKITNPIFLKNNSAVSLFLIGLGVIPIYICSYILSDAPPARMLLLSEFCFIFLIAFYLTKINFNTNYITIIATVLLVVYFIVEYPKTVNYHNNIKQQLLVLKKLNNKNFYGTYVWKNNPKSGLIYPTTIDKDSNYFVNQHVKKFMKLNFNIVSN